MKYQDFLKAKQSHVKPVGFDVDSREINRRLFDEKQETIADIVREMRIGDLCANDTTTSMVYINDILAGYADRIEAAAKREREATPEKSSVVANAMKMREALRGLLEIVCVDCKSSYEIDGKCVKCPRVVAAEAALKKAGGEE